MLKKIIISTAVAASALTVLPAAAEAQSRYGYSNRYDNRYDNRYYGQQRYVQNYDRRYANQRYNNQRTYNGGYYNHYGQRCSGSTDRWRRATSSAPSITCSVISTPRLH